MKKLSLAGVGFSLVAVLIIAGCTTRPTTLGPDPYLAYTMARDQQILNPEAGENLDPVQGTEDAKASKNTMERYRSSFENPETYRSSVSVPSVVSQGVQTQ